jgi:hypothetical protein
MSVADRAVRCVSVVRLAGKISASPAAPRTAEIVDALGIRAASARS